MLLVRERHNSIVELFKHHLRAGLTVSDEPNIDGLKPDLLNTDLDKKSALVQVSCPWDVNLDLAFNTKAEAYSSLPHPVLPLIIGALGTWHKRNNAVRAFCRLGRRCWSSLRLRMRVSNIEATSKLVRTHLRGVNLSRPPDC